MTKLSKNGLLLALGVSLSFGACKKDEKKEEKAQSEDHAAEQQSASEADEQTAAGESVAEKTGDHPQGEHPNADSDSSFDPETREEGDFLKVEASHNPKKPDDPTPIYFGGPTVISADFDPENLEGGTATLEIDLTDISSGIPKRDKHLMSDDYFDSEEHPKGTISVKDVKAKGEDVYSASAEVTVRGVTKRWPVEFKATTNEDNTVTVEASHTFERMDFEIGKEEAEGDSASNEVKAVLKVTLSPSEGEAKN